MVVKYSILVIGFAGRSKKFELTLLAAAIHHFWPAFIAIQGNPRYHPVKSAWMQACSDSPMMFFSLLLGAAHGHLSQRGGIDSHPENHLLRAGFHSLAIRNINAYISQLGVAEEPSDEIIASVLTLAVWSNEGPSPSSNAPSALAAAQHLDDVSHRAHVQAHRDALYHLIRRKGGLSKIALYGISHLTQT
jgi:hypothetical protein